MVARKGLRGISLARPTRGWGWGGKQSRRKENRIGFNFAQTLFLSQIAPFPMKGCVLERSTPFQLKCHSQISCLRGQRRSTHALFSEYLLQVPELASAHPTSPHPSPARKPYTKTGPGPDPARGKVCPTVSAGGPAWAAVAV